MAAVMPAVQAGTQKVAFEHHPRVRLRLGLGGIRVKMERITAYTDGGSRGGHTAGYGVVITSDDTETRVEMHEFIGKATNNEAEYRGLIAALQFAVERGTKRLKVFMDSELVVRQVTGIYTCKAPALRTLYAEAMYLIEKIPQFVIKHVRREFNKEADRLANIAMDEGTR